MPRRKRLLLLATMSSLLLGSCGSSQPSEPVNQSSQTSENKGGQASINQESSEKIIPAATLDNLIVPTNEVTTTKLVTYEGPRYLTSSSMVDISVNDQDLFVYETRVNPRRKFTWEVPNDKAPVAIFDFEGKVHVSIKVNGDANVTKASVSPMAYGVKATVENNVISFDLEYSANYVIEYNDDPSTAIHLFANPLEKEPITEEMAKKDSSITYIGPGVYKADAIPVSSNSTVYLAGGAYVYGQIRTEGLENIKIKGRGIISGNIYNRGSESEYTIPIELRTTKNVTIEGITILDPAGWTIALYKSENITLDNVKIITARQNGDGISVQSCKDVTVNGGFVRTWDDSLVVKNVDRGSTKNIKFDGVTVWTDLAQSMEVGYETYGPTMEDITFENITVVHNFHKAVISLHNCDDASISNVTYRNITVEDGQMLGDDRNDNENDFLIDMTIAYNVEWTKSAGARGSVNGVTIENVKVYNMLDSIVSRMNGESNTSAIENVKISGVEIEGKQITSAADLGLLTNNYTKSVEVKTKEKVLGAMIALPYKLNLVDNNVEKTLKENVNQEGILVPEFAKSKGGTPFIGVADSKTYTAEATHGAGSKTTTPADDGSGDFTKQGSNAANAVDKNSETSWTSGEWKNQADEFAALTIDFPELTTVGVIRLLGNPNNNYCYTYTFQVWGRKLKSDGSLNDKYTRILSLKDYQMSPGSSNCIDVNITAQQYKGLQLRFYRTDTTTSPSSYEVSEVQFFAPSLAYNKAIVDSSAHNDVYNVEKLVDGDATGTSYYESSGFPAYVVIDLGDVYNVNTFVMCLPPSLLWDARSQEIEILVSDSPNAYNSSTQFTSIVAKKSYLFDPATGNRNIVQLDSSVRARYIKVVISSNDIKGGYAAQLSEFSVYGD